VVWQSWYVILQRLYFFNLFNDLRAWHCKRSGIESCPTFTSGPAFALLFHWDFSTIKQLYLKAQLVGNKNEGYGGLCSFSTKRLLPGAEALVYVTKEY
jgi:hypothetical protein